MFAFCSKVSFQLALRRPNCFDEIDQFEEGVEFSIRTSLLPHDWIPLKFFFNDRFLPTPTPSMQRRGYLVPTVFITEESEEDIIINVCNISTDNISLQFRWLQTSTLLVNAPIDIWLLDNIKISVIDSVQENLTLLEENFDGNTLE